MPLRPSLALVLLWCPSLVFAQGHPGTAGATSVVYEELLSPGPTTRALLPRVSQSFASYTSQFGTTFSDRDVKVSASPSSFNSCPVTLGTWAAAMVIKTYLFNQTSIWGTLLEGNIEAALQQAIQRVITSAITAYNRDRMLDEIAEGVTDALEPYRQSGFTRAQAKLAVMSILALLDSALPSTRMSTHADFVANVTHTPLVQGNSLTNRFNWVSTIDTRTSIKTAGVLECLEWLIANVWTLALYGIPVPEEFFYNSTEVNRSFVPRGQTAFVAQLDVTNQISVTSAERQLKPTRIVDALTGAPRDEYKALVVSSEIPDSLKIAGFSTETQFRIQASQHLISVLQALAVAQYDAFTVAELRQLNDALNQETFFSWSDTTSAAQFNLDPTVGSISQGWFGAPASFSLSSSGGQGALLGIPALAMAPFSGLGPVNSGAFVPAAVTLSSPAIGAEQSVVSAGQQPLYVMRGLENSLFPSPLGGFGDDFDANVVTRLDLPMPLVDVNIRGRVMSVVAPPALYEAQGQKFIRLTVQVEVTVSNGTLPGSPVTGDVTFTVPVSEEFYKRSDEQSGDRTRRDWELRFVPYDPVVTSTFAASGSSLMTRDELHYLLRELLGPGVMRGVQAMGRDRVGSLHNFGSWGGFQNMARHHHSTQWQVLQPGPGPWGRLRLNQDSAAPTFDYGVRAPTSVPQSAPVGSFGELISRASTEHLPVQINELPQSDYAVRTLPDGSEEKFVVECRRSFFVPSPQGPVRVHTSYAYARTRLLRGEKKLVLTDGRYFNADNGVGRQKLGATNSNIAQIIFDYRNTAIPEPCKIYPDDRIYYFAQDPSGEPELKLTVLGEYDHGLEKSPSCNPHLKFPRQPYLPRMAQGTGIVPTFASTYMVTGAAAAKRHVVSEQQCGAVSIDVITSSGGEISKGEAIGAIEPHGSGSIEQSDQSH